MHLFSRRVMTAGPVPEVAAYLTDIRSYVSDKTGSEVGLWAAGFGAPVGTYVFNTRVDGLAGLQAMTATLMDDPTYHAKLAAGAAYQAAPAEDQMAEMLNGEPGDMPPVGSVAVVTTAVIGNGRYAEAVGWGLEMAEFATTVGGMPTGFYMTMYGTFGTVQWIGVAADAAAADQAGQAVNADPDYIAKLGSVGDLFVPGSGHRSLATRMA